MGEVDPCSKSELFILPPSVSGMPAQAAGSMICQTKHGMNRSQQSSWTNQAQQSRGI